MFYQAFVIYLFFIPGSFFFTGLYIILKSVVGVQPVFLAVWYTIFYGSSSNFLANLPSLEAVSQKVVWDPPFLLHNWIQCNFFDLGKSD